MACELHVNSWPSCIACQANAQSERLAGVFSCGCPECASGGSCGLRNISNARMNEQLFPKQKPTTNSQQGWKCPRCHTVHAPFVRACECRP